MKNIRIATYRKREDAPGEEEVFDIVEMPYRRRKDGRLSAQICFWLDKALDEGSSTRIDFVETDA